MFKLDARFTALLSVLFIAVGLFNLYIGRKRMLALRTRGYAVTWHKQTSILTGFEYVLLGIVLVLNSGISSGFFSNEQALFVIPLYTGALILAAVILLYLLYLRITSHRAQNARAARQEVAQEQISSGQKSVHPTPQERAAQTQRRRDRRKNAASARRRQAGKS
jgi:type IV secretory pathway VirB6-like protein